MFDHPSFAGFNPSSRAVNQPAGSILILSSERASDANRSGTKSKWHKPPVCTCFPPKVHDGTRTLRALTSDVTCRSNKLSA